MAQNERAASGRPRQYVPDVALARATEVFWDNGLTATSLDDLGQAMGMNRPSINAAFGDKSELFVKALRRYEEEGQKSVQRTLSPDLPLRESLRELFSMLLVQFLSGEDAPRGCLLFSVGTAEAVRTPSIRAVVDGAARSLDGAFEARFEIARKKGEVAPTANAANLALLASGLVHSLSIRARTGQKKSDLERVIEAFLVAICGPERKPQRSKRGSKRA
jgi:AcrR family transcriptional regulator